ncbi:hypothetical protein AMTRI_Chr06g170170 [Amborella trichopoda]
MLEIAGLHANPSASFPPSNHHFQTLRTQHHIIHLLQSCTTHNQLKQIHAQTLKSQLQAHNPIARKLIELYTTFENPHYAYTTLTQVQNPNASVYNALIKAHTSHGAHLLALILYTHMLSHGTQPDPFSFPIVLKACANLEARELGQQIHAQTLKFCVIVDPFVSNSLILMYSKFGLRDCARKVFDEVPTRNVVMWTTMIDVYTRAGLMDEAAEFFEKMPERNVLTWTAMISGHLRNGSPMLALGIFRAMQACGVHPDEVAVLGAISACARLGGLGIGKWAHVYVKAHGLDINKVSLANGLMDMYVKCGSLADALEVFNEMPKRSVVSYNTMVCGLAMHGKGKEAIELFENMQKDGFKPNEVTLAGVLSACAHSGLVDEGLNIFRSIEEKYGFCPNIRHYGCMVDLLGRAGQLKESHDLIKSMPFEPNEVIWGALLSACKMHGNLELAEYALVRVIELGPEGAGYYVLLSNAYAGLGRWHDSGRVRAIMKANGVSKTPGRSWIEANNNVHEFVSGDKSHPQSKEIHEMLDLLDDSLRLEGYVPGFFGTGDYG